MTNGRRAAIRLCSIALSVFAFVAFAVELGIALRTHASIPAAQLVTNLVAVALSLVLDRAARRA